MPDEDTTARLEKSERLMNEIEVQANELAARIKRQYPEVKTWVSLETVEGEDAYLWIAAPRAKIDEIMTEAAGMIGELWEAGFYIVPRMKVLDQKDTA